MRYDPEGLKDLFETETVKEVAQALNVCRLTVKNWQAGNCSINGHHAEIIMQNYPWITLKPVLKGEEGEDEYSDLNPAGILFPQDGPFDTDIDLERRDELRKMIQEVVRGYFRDELIPALDAWLAKKLEGVGQR